MLIYETKKYFINLLFFVLRVKIRSQIMVTINYVLQKYSYPGLINILYGIGIPNVYLSESSVHKVYYKAHLLGTKVLIKRTIIHPAMSLIS